MNNEPVAWMSSQTDGDGDTLTMFSTYHDPLNAKQIPLYTHPVKELTDEEIHQAIRQGFARDGFLSDGIFLEIKELLRKESEK